MSRPSLCRLCLQEQKECVPLTENRGTEMLETLTSIKFTYNEKISTLICPQCYQDLTTAFNIQQKLLKVELQHQDNLLADFLTQNHDELKKLAPEDLQIKDVARTTTMEHQLKPEVNQSPVRHSCGLCCDKFQFPVEFVDHLKQHILSGVKTVKLPEKCEILCEQCGDIFTSSETYDEHRRAVHPGFVCGTCSECFGSNDDLEEHVKEKHTELKQFVCDICNEKFSLRYILQVHKVQHSIKYPFVCDDCGRSFKYLVSLGVHQKMKHSPGGADNHQFAITLKKQLFK